MDTAIWLVVTGGILVMCVFVVLRKSGTTVTIIEEEES